MKKQRFLLSVFMAIVMIAMSPMKMWAQSPEPSPVIEEDGDMLQVTCTSPNNGQGYGTIILPSEYIFDVVNAELYRISNLDNGNVYVTAVDNGSVTSGDPFIFKGTVTFTCQKDNFGSVTPQEFGAVSFTGTFEEKTLDPGPDYVYFDIDSEKFVYPYPDAVTVNPFHCYFEGQNIQSVLSIVLDDDDSGDDDNDSGDDGEDSGDGGEELVPELYVLDLYDWYRLPLYETADPVVTEDGTHVHTAEVYYYDEIDSEYVDLYASSNVDDFTAEVDEDDPTQLTVTLTSKSGTTSIYNITVSTDCVYVDGYPNSLDRGLITVAMDGKELYAETDYFEIFVPTGGSITLTATPKREDCSIAKWTVYDYDNYEILTESVESKFIYENITKDSEIEAGFSSNQYILIGHIVAGPGVTTMTIDEAPFSGYDAEILLGTEVTLSTTLQSIPEAEQGKITFDGWYIEGKDEKVSDDETITLTPEEDCYIYAQYTQTLPVTNGWISYDDGFAIYRVEGGTAYAAAYVADGGDGNPAVKLTAIDDDIYYTQPILIHSDQSTVTIKYSYHPAAQYDTDLVGNTGVNWDYMHDKYTDAGPLDLEAEYTYYALYNKIEPVEFRPYTGGVIPRHKAVLKVDDGGSASRLSVIFDDEETTGLHTLAEDQQRKEQLLDLLGRPLSHEHRGLMVKDGKVIMQK